MAAAILAAVETKRLKKHAAWGRAISWPVKQKSLVTNQNAKRLPHERLGLLAVSMEPILMAGKRL